MPTSINGFGTILYGKRSLRTDGSYVTTQWFAVLWLPILPVKSMRIKETGSRQSGLFSHMEYAILEELPFQLPQILETYLFAGVLLGSSVFLGSTKKGVSRLVSLVILGANSVSRQRLSESNG